MKAKALERLESLPPIPMVAQEILKVLNDNHASIAQVAKAISLEPGLTGKLVASANAAFFSGQRPIYSVDDAAVRLGLNRVRVMATSVLLGAQLNTARCPSFDARRFWSQAMKAASCAGKLVQLVPVETAKEAANLCGLLHNIGLLANAHCFPEEMESILQGLAVDPGFPLSAREEQALGFNHHEAGGELLSRWQMPAEIVAAVRHVQDDGYQGDYARLAEVVRLAVRWAEGNFEQLPDFSTLRGVEEAKLKQIGDSCRREAGQLEAFAQMMGAAA